MHALWVSCKVALPTCIQALCLQNLQVLSASAMSGVRPCVCTCMCSQEVSVFDLWGSVVHGARQRVYRGALWVGPHALWMSVARTPSVRKFAVSVLTCPMMCDVP